MLHDKVDDDEMINSYPQMISVSSNCSCGQEKTYSSPTKFSSKYYESLKSDCISPTTNNSPKYSSYKAEDGTFTSDDYSTITTNYSANEQNPKSMQVTSKLAPIYDRSHPQRSKNSRTSEKSMNNSGKSDRGPSNRGEVLQIDVDGSDSSSDDEGVIKITIGNMISKPPFRAESRNPFLINEHSTLACANIDIEHNNNRDSFYQSTDIQQQARSHQKLFSEQSDQYEQQIIHRDTIENHQTDSESRLVMVDERDNGRAQDSCHQYPRIAVDSMRKNRSPVGEADDGKHRINNRLNQTQQQTDVIEPESGNVLYSSDIVHESTKKQNPFNIECTQEQRRENTVDNAINANATTTHTTAITTTTTTATATTTTTAKASSLNDSTTIATNYDISTKQNENIQKTSQAKPECPGRPISDTT